MSETQSKTKKLENKKQPKSTFIKFFKKNWITILAFLYVVSPVDLLPEALLPLIGETDDLILIIIEIIRQWHLFKKKDQPDN